MKSRILLLLVVGLALVVRIAVLGTHTPDKTPWSDGAQYVNLGMSLADGKGYVLDQGNLWPGQPTIIRAPGWPVVLSLLFHVVPVEWRWPAAMGLAVALDGINVLLLYLLARGIGGGRWTALAAACLYALSPVMAAMCLTPASEVLGISMILLFLNYLVRINIGGWKLPLAGLILGVAALVRPNFVLIGFALVPGLLWLGRRTPVRSLCLSGLFLLAVMTPLTPWLIRNAMIFGHFPILGAGGGETLYGGNNDLAALPGGKYEGYLVLPGDLPNETSLMTLAATMNEYQVDRYLWQHGKDWIKSNPGKMPRLILMKLRRAYIPIPRSGGGAVLVASFYRASVDVLAIIGVGYILRKRLQVPALVWVGFMAVFAAHLAVVAVFCGLNRFALPSEILLALPAGYVVDVWISHRPGGVRGSPPELFAVNNSTCYTRSSH